VAAEGVAFEGDIGEHMVDLASAGKVGVVINQESRQLRVHSEEVARKGSRKGSGTFFRG